MTFIKLSIALFLSAILTHSVSAQSSLMSFNIRYDNQDDGKNAWTERKLDLVNLIKSENPEILCIQEGLYHQLMFIQDELDGYSFTGVGREDAQTGGEYCAIFYPYNKLRLNSSFTYWLSPTPEVVSIGWDAALERIVTYAQFSDLQGGNTIHVFNTHFDHLGEQARENSAKLILSLIKKHTSENDKIILAGDLNTEADSEPVKILKGYLSDSAEKHFGGSSPEEGTFNGFDETEIPRRIDYIFTKNVIVSTYKVIKTRRDNNLFISDHFPVMIRF
ncbi:MAG: endonuclease/exonuclease/phosphatase family protein [Bacteroidia bacterium]